MENYKEIFDNDIKFYYMNLTNGYKKSEKAKEILAERCNHDYKLLCELSNYDEIGLVEYVIAGNFDIDYENMKIIKEEY